MPLQYTWRASKFFIFFIKVRAVDIITLGTDFLPKKNTRLWLGGDSPRATATKTSLKKRIRATSNCIAPILTRSNVGKCLWSWILRHCIKVQENKKKVVVLCSRPRELCEREFRYFHVVLVQRRQRNVQKKRDARAKLLSCRSKPIAFLPSLLLSPPWDAYWKGSYFVVTAMVWLVRIVLKGKLKTIKSCEAKKGRLATTS